MTPNAPGQRGSHARGGRRRRARELALRVLFELEGTDRPLETALEYQARDMGATPDVQEYALQIATGVMGKRGEIDHAISEASTKWDLQDLGKVERAVLRMGVFELTDMPGLPPAVAIDEALEIARIYAGDEAVPIVNGVLGNIARSSGLA